MVNAGNNTGNISSNYPVTMKNKMNNSSGFSLAEMLLVVAIIMVLAGVSFIAVINYQRSLTQFERDGIAREIFIAAQNHLTLAESEGYLGAGAGDFGTEDTDDEAVGVYYYIVNKGDAFSDGGTGKPSVLNQMLPTGSVDETVRLGGNYVIRYQKTKSSAQVLDVFYSTAKDTRFGHDFSESDYASLKSEGEDGYKGNDNKSRRRNCGLDDPASILGWYGGEEGLQLIAGGVTEHFEAPILEVFNEEKLYVKVTDPNYAIADSSLTLEVRNNDSNDGSNNSNNDGSDNGNNGNNLLIASGKTFILRNTGVNNGNDGIYYVVLDDITSNTEKYDYVMSGTGCYPGGDIAIQAKVTSTGKLSNIALSMRKTTNSLFSKIEKDESALNDSSYIASISNIRHLENLGRNISNVGNSPINPFTVTHAKQLTDLSWKVFLDKNNKINEILSPTNPDYYTGYYTPVNPGTPLDYDGQMHRISDVMINEADADSGIFGFLRDGSVNNLQLIDIGVNAGNGDAGALAGRSEDTDFTNVIARNSTKAASKTISGTGFGGANAITYDLKIEASGSGRNAGGLIGAMSGGEVKACAAAIIVNASGDAVSDAVGDAGGLIGRADGVSGIIACYSGGRVKDGTGIYDQDNMNVTSRNGNAGGLIGSMNENNGGTVSTDIKYCYSTCSACSVSKGYAGGLAGVIKNANIDDCYSTGLVRALNANAGQGNKLDIERTGAFAGTISDNSNVSNCQYYEIINEIPLTEDGDIAGADDDVAGFDYMSALAKKEGTGETEGIEGTEGTDEINGKITPLDADFDLSYRNYRNNTENAGTQEPHMEAHAEPYSEFIGEIGEWQPADSYEPFLLKWFQKDSRGKYNLKTVEELALLVEDDVSWKEEGVTYFVTTHYGDWPVPEYMLRYSNTQ